jgi:integrase
MRELRRAIMKSQRIPGYRHHKPSNQAVVTIDGHDIYLGKYGTPTSKLEYDRLVKVWLEGGRKLPEGTADVSVVELIRDYLKYASTYYMKAGRQTSYFERVKHVLKGVRERFGPEPVKAFDVLKLERLRQGWIDAGLSRETCNANMFIVRRMFRWGVRRKLVPAIVSHELRELETLAAGRSAAYEPRRVVPVPDADLAAVLPRLPRPLADACRLMEISGMRPGECLAMRPADLDRPSPTLWTYRVSQDIYKSAHLDKSRVVLLGPKCIGILSHWVGRRGRTDYIFQSPRSARRGGGKASVPYTLSALRTAIRRECRRAGVDHWHPNQLRHNAATTLRKQFGIEIARVVLGHGSATMTEVYAEMDLGKARAIMESVG